MIDLLVVLGLLAGGGGLAGLGAWALTPPSVSWSWRRFRFPNDLSAEQVQALLDVVAGTRRGTVCLIIDSGVSGVTFSIGAPTSTLLTVTRALSGIAPAVRLDEIDAPEGEPFTRALAVQWTGRWPLLRTDTPELAASALLGAMTGLNSGERLRVLFTLAPARHSSPPRPDTRAENNLSRETLRAVRVKVAEPLLRTDITVATSAEPEVRARQLLQRVVTVLRGRRGLRGELRFRRLSPGSASNAAAGTPGRFSRRRATLLRTSELAGLLGLPLEGPVVPGLAYGTEPRLLAPHDLPRTGRVFGTSTWPGHLDRPIAQPLIGGLQHTAVIGGTGSGKSTLIQHLVHQDISSGRGALVVDVKGDLIQDVLARIPDHRRNDVIVLDPAQDGPQPGLRLFPAGGGDTELTADLIAGTLRQIWPDTFGVRSAQYFRMGLVTLGRVPGATLVDLPVLFTDVAFRRRAVARVSDPLLRNAWERFEGLSPADQAAQLASPMGKLEELTSRARLRVVLGQSRPRLAFSEVLARGRILLVRLPPGLLGTPAVRLLSALVLWQFFSAVEARAALPPTKRHQFHVYIDEVAALNGIGLPLGDLLERARGLGVGLLLAPQALSQLKPELQRAMLANVGSLLAFRLSAAEARAVAAELPGVTPEQLQHLRRFETAVRLSLGPGETTPTMTAAMTPPSAEISDPADLQRHSGQNWGVSIEEVDQELAERLGIRSTGHANSPDPDDPAAPVGSRQRTR